MSKIAFTVSVKVPGWQLKCPCQALSRCVCLWQVVAAAPANCTERRGGSLCTCPAKPIIQKQFPFLQLFVVFFLVAGDNLIGKPLLTKTDKFSEKFQTAFDPHLRHFRKSYCKFWGHVEVVRVFPGDPIYCLLNKMHKLGTRKPNGAFCGDF